MRLIRAWCFAPVEDAIYASFATPLVPWLPPWTGSAPDLTPRTWYGMPAYAKDGTVVCFFQSAQKFNSRYATLGFSDRAGLDDGAMWPTYFALSELTAVEEARIGALVKQAVS